jgi:F-type H+-transporting ATPase subunit c
MNPKKLILCLLAGAAVLAVSAVAFAQPAAAAALSEEAAKAVSKNDLGKWIALAAGLGIAIAAFGGALGQGRAAAAALDGIARNPSAADKMFTPMILGLALIESLVIYSLIISFMLVGKL